MVFSLGARTRAAASNPPCCAGVQRVTLEGKLALDRRDPSRVSRFSAGLACSEAGRKCRRFFECATRFASRICDVLAGAPARL